MTAAVLSPSLFFDGWLTRPGAVHTDADDEKSIPAPADETPKEKKQPKRPRHSSPRESKAAQRMLNQLLDQISGHRNGNVFAQPVRAVSLSLPAFSTYTAIMVKSIDRCDLEYRTGLP